jgi:hypothetical protein
VRIRGFGAAGGERPTVPVRPRLSAAPSPASHGFRGLQIHFKTIRVRCHLAIQFNDDIVLGPARARTRVSIKLRIYPDKE